MKSIASCTESSGLGVLSREDPAVILVDAGRPSASCTLLGRCTPCADELPAFTLLLHSDLNPKPACQAIARQLNAASWRAA